MLQADIGDVPKSAITLHLAGDTAIDRVDGHGVERTDCGRLVVGAYQHHVAALMVDNLEHGHPFVGEVQPRTSQESQGLGIQISPLPIHREAIDP